MRSLATLAFMTELRVQDRAAKIGARRLQKMLDRQVEKPASSRGEFIEWQDECFTALQTILTAAALVSKCLWGSERDAVAAERSHVLRGLLAIDSPTTSGEVAFTVLRRRDVRNGFEHFDERLDAHLMANDHILDRNIGQALTDSDMPHLRHFDPQTWVVSVLDASVDVRALLNELAVVADRAAECTREAFARSSMSSSDLP